MNATIIVIGDEILIGQVLDTNSNWLATVVTKLGFNVVAIVAVSDKKESISNALDSAAKSDLTIITGGLGPTKDDITKNILAEHFNDKLEFNEFVYQDICCFINSLGAHMNSLNKDQALFPAKAMVLRNRQGTAPGIWYEKNGNITISLPGVPFEMKAIVEQEVIPKLKQHFDLPIIKYQTIMIAGYGESQLALKLEDWENRLSQKMKIAYLPSPGIIKLRLGFSGNNLDEINNTLNIEIQKLLQIIPDHIFSINESTLELEVGKLLNNKKKRISTAESCTGGNIAKLITSVPGSSLYFEGSVVAYSNEIKNKLLDVSKETIEKYGAVSKEVVEAMAFGAKTKFNTNYSIATSGIAGPDGGTEEKPVGTVWIAISGPNGTISKLFRFGTKRDINIIRSSMAALNMLRLELIKC